MTCNLIRLILLPVTLFACAAALQAAEVTVVSPDSLMLRFAVGKLKSVVQRQAGTFKWTTKQAPGQRAEIVVTVDPALIPGRAEPGPEESIGWGQSRSFHGALHHAELVS
jgi:hypothetical protein